MIDAEVARLRELRNVALRVRALARGLDRDLAADNSMFTKSAVLCWNIARVAAGRLQAHPYLSYQKGPSPVRSWSDRMAVSAIALLARYQGRSLNVLATELQLLTRELDDTRALTWSPDLSDALGRAQMQMRRLVGELHVAAPSQQRMDHGISAASRTEAQAKIAASANTLGDIEVASNWPYLAI
jgi:hypothetical protein